MLGDRFHQFVLRDTVEVAFEVGIHHPDSACVQQVIHSPQRVFGPASRSESVTVLGQDVLEDRFDHISHRRLHDAILHHWNSQRPEFPAAQLWYPDPFDGLGGVWPLSQPVLHSAQPLGAFQQILLCLLAVHSGRSLVLHDRFQGALQVFLFPYFIDQTEPFASFDSSFEGFQHAFCPHACFRPVSLRGDFSALFSLRHSRQFELRLCFFHASTFLSPLAPRSLPASSLLRGL